MSGYNNAAGRLLRYMDRFEQRLGKDNNQDNLLTVWADVLGTKTDERAIYGPLNDLSDLLAEVMLFAKENEPTDSRWLRMQPLEKAFRPIGLSQPARSCGIDNSQILILDHFATLMPSESDVDKSSLEGLLAEVNELSAYVRTLDDLPKQLKTWVLELLLMVLDGISKSAIYGGKGLRREFYKMAGTFAERYGELQDKSPTVYEKIHSVLQRLAFVVQTADQAHRLAGNAMKLLGITGDTDTPAGE